MIVVLAAPAYVWPGPGPWLTVSYILLQSLFALLAGLLLVFDESSKPLVRGGRGLPDLPRSDHRRVREVGATSLFTICGFVLSILAALVCDLAYGTPEKVGWLRDALRLIGLPAPD